MRQRRNSTRRRARAVYAEIVSDYELQKKRLAQAAVATLNYSEATSALKES